MTTVKEWRLGANRGALLILVGTVVITGSIGTFIHGLDVFPTRISEDLAGSSSRQGYLPLLLSQRVQGEPGLAEAHTASLFGSKGNDDLSSADRTADKTSSTDTAREATKAPPIVPQRIVISSIDLDAPIQPAESERYEEDGQEFLLWSAPERYAAGWHPDSAGLGVPGNTVINGHHNVHGEVFRYLEDLEGGETIVLYADGQAFYYRLEEKILVQERYKSLETRLQNASWIKPTQDERITLVTCWPYQDNSYRLILIAKPLMDGVLQHTQ